MSARPTDRFIRSDVLLNIFMYTSMACLASALLAFVYLGLFNRYLIDDYCIAAALRDKGFFSSQAYWFQTWSGRYSYNLLATSLAVAGPLTTIVTPALSIVAWLMAIVWSIRQFCPKQYVSGPASLLWLTALLLAYTTMQGAPNLLQSFYWQAGMLTYAIPIIVLTAYAGFIRKMAGRSHQRVIWLLASAAITLFAGGLSETALALEGGACLIMIAICLAAPAGSIRRNAFPLLMAGLTGAIMSLIVQLLSPGNAARAAIYPAHVSVFSMLAMSVSETFDFIRISVLTRAPLTLSVALVLPFLLGLMTDKDGEPTPNDKLLLRLLTMLPVVTIMLVWFCILPSIYAMPFPPMRRVLVMPHYVISIFCIAEGYLVGIIAGQAIRIGIKAKQLVAGVLAAAVLILGPLFAAKRTVRLAGRLTSHAERWDEAQLSMRLARQQGSAAFDIPNLAWFSKTINAFDDFAATEADPDFVVHTCVESYYQMRVGKRAE